MKIKLTLLILLSAISINCNAWMMQAGTPMCLSMSALNSYEIKQTGARISEQEQIRIDNDCDNEHEKVKVEPHFMGVYSKVQAINFEYKREIYYVSTRDLIKD